MKQQHQSILGKVLVASLILLLLAGSPMSYFTDRPANVHAEPGETVTLQFTFHHDAAEWVGPYVGLWQEPSYDESDKVVWTGHIGQDNSKTFTVDYTVPSTPGTYEMQYRMRSYEGGGDYDGTDLGTDTVKFTVDEPPEEPPEEPEEPTYPEEPDYEGNLSNMGVFDKIVLLIQTVLAYLFGGTA